ncbi:VanW family protein, partial [Patescibacteria group bacterium]|nr:VanW family protein [Patescibacteria group bacterium]
MFLKKLKKLIKKINTKYLLIPLVLLLIIIISIAFLHIYSLGKISPGIKIAGYDVSNKTKGQAYKILLENITPKENLNLVSKDDKYEINLKDLNFNYDFSKSVERAYYTTRSGNFFYDLGIKIKLLYKKENLGLEIVLDEKILEDKIQEFGKNLEVKPVEPNISLLNNVINIQKGTKGVVIDYLKLRANIGKSLAFLEENEIEIPLMEEGDILNEIEIQSAKDRASKIIGKTIRLKYNESNFILNDQVLVGFLNPKKEYFNEKILAKISEISSQIDREPQNSVFVFEESRVKEFKPSLDGYKVEKDILKNMIIGNLRTLEQSEEKSINLDIPVNISKPKIQNKDVNNLGIETLLGRGTSKFVGSIANRIYNIKHASAKFKGIIIPPGENFSFNQTLGEVSQETGFKQAYIIKEGKTILGDGGGVCQVSTTLFRAELNA